MLYKEGYVYHIKDEKNSLLWMIPLSSRVDKFKVIHDKHVKKYGRCLTIVLGEFDGKNAAFLLQNMFPVTEHYLDHMHTRNNNPVPIKHSLEKIMLKELNSRHTLETDNETSPDPFYSEPNLKQLEKN